MTLSFQARVCGDTELILSHINSQADVWSKKFIAGIPLQHSFTDLEETHFKCCEIY